MLFVYGLDGLAGKNPQKSLYPHHGPVAVSLGTCFGTFGFWRSCPANGAAKPETCQKNV